MRKLFVSICSVTLVIALIFTIGISALKIYADKNVDYSLDERLFETAKASSTATFMAYNESGELIEYYKGNRGVRKTWYDFDDISEYLKLALLSIEDRHFYSHKGVDVKRTIAAAINQLTGAKPTFGASTITQQVIKNISGDNEQTLQRKLNEILRAIHLEMTYTKDEIFELYLNVIPMTGTIYGVGEASYEYFGKEPSELSVDEAATIAGITNSPVKYNPYTNSENCLNRRNLILTRMRDESFITEEEYTVAISKPLSLVETRPGQDICPWFVECAIDEITEDLVKAYSITESTAKIMLYSGTTTFLTVNPKVQSIVEKYFENPENLDPQVKEGLQYAFCVQDPFTNDLLAIIGQAGRKEGNRLLNYALAPQNPASALKPIALYAPLIDSGDAVWSTMVDDTPVEYYEAEDERIGYPKNSPDVYDGRITVADAIKRSKNTVAVKIYNALGAESIFHSLTVNYGFDSLVESEMIDGKTYSDKCAAGLALGQLTHGIPLRDLTASYEIFTHGGVLNKSRSYYGVQDINGKTLINNKSGQKKIISNESAELMTQLLKSVVDNGTARSLSLKYSVDTAGKTGTSGGGADRWFIGFTPYYIGGIWCGYGDNRPISGLKKTHLSVWDDIMTELHEREVFNKNKESIKDFNTENLVTDLYCTESGFLAGYECIELGYAELGYYKKSSPPVRYCPIHKQ